MRKLINNLKTIDAIDVIIVLSALGLLFGYLFY